MITILKATLNPIQECYNHLEFMVAITEVVEIFGMGKV